MSYRQFTTLKKATDAFSLEVVEAQFFPEIPPIAPSSKLLDYLEDTLPIAAIGQCVAEMVAAQRFNEAVGQHIPKVYGSISSGTQWRFLQLEGNTVTIDLTDYPLPPIDRVLANLVWMVQ